MNSSFLLHESIIEFILLILIVILYYSKLIPKEYMAICLLGTYILLKSIITLLHWRYHKFMLHE
jgi:hypothetical protein